MSTALAFYVVALVAFGFWLIQVIDLLMRDVRDFENHTHKLMWFLALVTGSLAGAIWCSIWKKRLATAKPQVEKQ
jgi:hypothetical protein